MKRKKITANKKRASIINRDFINPEETVANWRIKKGETIADLGCGSGYFTIPLAAQTGEEGKVYAVDLIENLLEVVKSRAYLEKLNNISIIRADLEKKNALESKIRTGECQLVLIANLLYTAKKISSILREAKRILAKDGKIIVIEWSKDAKSNLDNFGPDRELRIAEKDLKQMASKEGLALKNYFAAGSFHYGMVFGRK